MVRFFGVLAAVVALGLFAAPRGGQAEEVSVLGEGAVTAEGYVFRAPFFYKDGQPYVRAQVSYTVQTPYQTPSTYYYCGRAYTSYSTAYTTETKYRYAYTSVPIPKASDPDYRSKLLDIYSQKAKYDALLVKSRVDSENFAADVRVLGLDQNLFRYSGVIGSPYNGYASQVAYSSAGVQGQTIYGHSYAELRDIYGVANVDILFQAAGQATMASIAASDRAHGSLLTVTDRVGVRLAQAAEIQAKGSAAAQALDAARSSVSIHTENRGGTLTIGPSGQLEQREVIPLPKFTGTQARTQYCAACHSGQRVEGGFDVTSLATAAKEVKAKALDRVLSKDPKLIMPRNEQDPSQPGPRLTPDIIRKLFEE